MKNPFYNTITDEAWEKSEKRYAAFYAGSVADRPPVCIYFNKTNDKFKEKQYATLYDRWTDVKYRAEAAAFNIKNTEFYSDALPLAYPNLGPEIFTAYAGAKYVFTESSGWSEPCILDWERDADLAVIDYNCKWFKMTEEYTRELNRYAKGSYAVGFTDFHPGGDHVAALRDPQILCTDLYDCPEQVKAKMKSAYDEYFAVYEHFYEIIKETGATYTTSWMPLLAEGRFYPVSNDFSCMISVKMFEEFFLDGNAEEIGRLDKSIYHLDGPEALKHLDNLLAIKKLNAVQWVPGAGNEGFANWTGVYQKIQRAGKGIQLHAHINELDDVFSNLKPDGVWFSGISGVDSKETADIVLKRITNWK